jgi:hypothetical protein
MVKLVENGKIPKSQAITQLERKLREDPSCRRAKNLLDALKTL